MVRCLTSWIPVREGSRLLPGAMLEGENTMACEYVSLNYEALSCRSVNHINSCTKKNVDPVELDIGSHF